MIWWQYLMLVNIYLLLFYGFYVLLLSRETFFQLNRVYLVAAALLSFFIPLIQSDWVKNLFITQKVQYGIYSSPVMIYRFKPIQDTHVTMGQVLMVIYFFGIVFLTVRFIWQMIALRRIIDQPEPATAYSFFKKIRLADDATNNKVIAAHEAVHASQWHSADVLLIEAVMIINWFNPIVYLYRFTIKHIHEFIADRQVLKTGTAKADYALLLLSQTFNTPAHHLVNPFFNKSLLKQRIMMLQKSNSQKVALVKYGLSAPLFVLMLILSSATVNNSKTVHFINKKAEQVFLAPATGNSEVKLTSNAINKTGLKDAIIPVDTVRKDDGPVFTSVEQVPEFPGGLTAFGEFLSKNIKYPVDARKKGIQGRVIISFVVEQDGSLTNFHVARSIGGGCDEESVRVLALSPNWKPGTQNGKTVRVAYSVPIQFTLEVGKSTENKTGAVKETSTNSSLAMSDQPKYDTTKKQVAINSNEAFGTPLYIVDGVEVSNLGLINANNIKSINVIKDKSKIALYGPKAVNGIVVVTTKNDLIKFSAGKL